MINIFINIKKNYVSVFMYIDIDDTYILYIYHSAVRIDIKNLKVN